MLQVCVLGSGYVGLVAAACFAELGHGVVGCDIDKQRIDQLRNNYVPIFEPGLSELVEVGQKSGQLSFSDDVGAAINPADIIIVAVGTPSDETGAIDKTALQAATRSITEHAKDGSLVVIKSTVIPGTCAELTGWLKDKNIGLVSNPEFLREGKAVQDFMHPDRILIGIEDAEHEKIMRSLYGRLAEENKFIVTSLASAELAKYACNALLAVRLSFVNEVADLCAATGADFRQVQEVMKSDSRIGDSYLQAGPGYGGSCLPKDTRALLSMAESLGVEVATLQGAITANETRKARLIDKVQARVSVQGKRIALLGLAFKAGSDDIRESSSVQLARDLLQAGAELAMHDPKAMPHVQAVLPNVHYGDSPQAVLQNAEATIIMTEWQEYKKLTPADFKNMQGDIVIDFRNLYDGKKMAAGGLRYYPLDAGD